MNSFLERIVLTTARSRRPKGRRHEHTLSRYEIARGYHDLRRRTIGVAKDVGVTLLGIFSAAFGLKSFLMPVDFIDGGATGLALLGTVITPLSLPVLLVIMNAPFVYVAYRIMGREFAWRTALSIGVLALVTATVTFPDVTHDKLLIAVFGGFFLGAGIGFAVRGGCVIDGTEVLAIWLSRKLHVTMGDVITFINIFIFAAAARLINVETALYSMITYLAASRTVDFIVEGIEEYIGITIISPKHDEIQHMLVEVLGRGVTVYMGKRGYRKGGGSYEVDIIYCVITRLELHKVTNEVEKLDPNAFLVMSSVKDITGGIVKKRRFKH